MPKYLHNPSEIKLFLNIEDKEFGVEIRFNLPNVVLKSEI